MHTLITVSSNIYASILQRILLGKTHRQTFGKITISHLDETQ